MKCKKCGKEPAPHILGAEDLCDECYRKKKHPHKPHDFYDTLLELQQENERKSKRQQLKENKKHPYKNKRR